MALRGIDEHDDVTANHIMLSYNWGDQPTVTRINESLQRRKYITWLDTERMKGSIMDA